MTEFMPATGLGPIALALTACRDAKKTRRRK